MWMYQTVLSFFQWNHQLSLRPKGRRDKPLHCLWKKKIILIIYVNIQLFVQPDSVVKRKQKGKKAVYWVKIEPKCRFCFTYMSITQSWECVVHQSWLCVKPDGFVAETVLFLRMSKICPECNLLPMGVPQAILGLGAISGFPWSSLLLNNEMHLFFQDRVLTFPSCRKLEGALFWLLFRMKTCLEMWEAPPYRAEHLSFYQLLQNHSALWRWRPCARSIPQRQDRNIIKSLKQTISQLLL